MKTGTKLTMWIVALAEVLLLTAAQAIAPCTTVVNTDDSGPGSLRAALACAASGDTIDATGVSGTITLTSGELLVTNSVTILGPGPAALAVDGNAASRVFYVGSAVTVTISGLTITNGLATGIGPNTDGGGIYNDHSTLTVSNCFLSGNLAGNTGGGILNDGEYGSATLTVIDSTLSSNAANSGSGGGGINNYGYQGTGTVMVANSTLSGNSAGYGGGINSYGEYGSVAVTVADSTLSGNTASHYGGGILNDGSEGSATLTVADSILSGNAASYGGGGIYNEGCCSGSATLTVADSILSGNAASHDGGGIYNDGDSGSATLTITNCTLSGNAASDAGGGIFNLGSSGGSATLTVTISTVSSNSAATGGGIYNYAPEGTGTVMVANSTFSGNSTTASGGGIYSYTPGGSGILTVTDSTLSGNSAGDGGGGIYNDGYYGSGTLTMTNCTLSGNAAGFAGAIGNDSGSTGSATLTLANCTLSGNWDENYAGGIYNSGGSATVEIVSTILNAGSAGVNILNDDIRPGTITSIGYNLSSDDGGGFLTAAGDQINTDPRLGPLADNGGPTFTHALLSCSPAIDAGDPSFASPPDYDQRGSGYPRVVLDVIDIGAFEALSTTCTFGVQPVSYTIAKAGGSAAFSVTPRTVDCVWTPVSNDAFITIDGVEPGPGGQGNVSYSVAANDGGPRTGTVSVACMTFVVVQEGCEYSISPTSATIGAVGDSGSVTVTANFSDCDWTAVSNDGFITIDSGNSGSGNGSVGYTVAANSSNSPRSGTLTIAGQTFTVNQSGAKADIRLSMSDVRTSSKGTAYVTYTLTVTNAGPSTAINVVATDQVPTDTTFVSASANVGSLITPPVGETGTVTWTVGDLSSSDATAAEIQVTVAIKGKATISNTASVTSDTPDPNLANNTAESATPTKGRRK